MINGVNNLNLLKLDKNNIKFVKRRSKSSNIFSFRDKIEIDNKLNPEQIIESILSKIITKNNNKSNSKKFERSKINMRYSNFNFIENNNKNNSFDFNCNLKNIKNSNLNNTNLHSLNTKMSAFSNINKFNAKNYNTKTDEEKFCKLFVGKDLSNYYDKNEIEFEEFNTEKQSAKESLKMSIRDIENNSIKNKCMHNNANVNNEVKNLNNNINNNKLIDSNNNDCEFYFHGIFSLYSEGNAIFTSFDDTIFKFPIPVVGFNFVKGSLYKFSFNSIKKLSQKRNEVNNIFSKYLFNN